jgi:hypothetical protein
MNKRFDSFLHQKVKLIYIRKGYRFNKDKSENSKIHHIKLSKNDQKGELVVQLQIYYGSDNDQSESSLEEKVIPFVCHNGKQYQQLYEHLNHAIHFYNDKN